VILLILARAMYMTSRLLTLALFALAAYGPVSAEVGTIQAEYARPSFSQPVYHAHVPRRAYRNSRCDQEHPPEPIAMETAAIEDSEENSTGRSRGDETRSFHDLPEVRSGLHHPPSAEAHPAVLAPDRSLIYRLCKLLI
jgi:hypothetical protein